MSSEDVVTIDDDSRASNQNASVAIVDDEPIENDSQADSGSEDEDDEEFKSNKMPRLDPTADANSKDDDQEDNEVN